MVRARDVARLLRWAQSLDDLPPDRSLRMRSVAEALCHIVGGKLGAMGRGEGFLPQDTPRHTFGIAGGSIDDSERAIFVRYASGDASVDPCIPALAAQPHRSFAVLRRQIVTNRQWYAAPHVSEDRRAAGVDDVIYSVRRLGRSGATQMMALHRPWGDHRPFIQRDVTLIRLLHLAITKKVEPLRPMSGPTRLARQLSPRLRQTLGRLLSGESEKQIAAEFGLSQHTVHGYLKTIYSHFGAGSRGALLSLWVETGDKPV